MNNNFIEVLLCIKVPNSELCFDWKKGHAKCDHFKSGDCEFGMRPVFNKEDGVYLKPLSCKRLLFKENIR